MAKRQPSGGRRNEVHRIGYPDQVGVGVRQHHLLGEGAGQGEARLFLVRAHLGVTGQAELAPAAAEHERRGDPIPDRPIPDVRSDDGNRAGELVPGHMGQGDRIMTLPRMPVGPADSGCRDVDDDAVRRADRRGDVDQFQRPVGLREPQGPHGLTSTLIERR